MHLRRVTALAGGVGAARFLRGLLDVLAHDHPDSELTIIGNTADDMRLHGLHISPDLDTVMYTLGGGIDETQGWGRADEGFLIGEELAAYGVEPRWFTLGDRDLATHIVRTQMLGGYSLSTVTAALARRWFAKLPLPTRLLPMSDDRVETHVVVADGSVGRRALHFQEWWVRHRASLPAQRFVLVGIEQAAPAPGVLSSIEQADVIIVPPSNPVVSIGPIISVPGIRHALRNSTAPVVGLSPIIGGRPVRGMADACLRAVGVETSASAVAALYADFLDAWLVDSSDAETLPVIAASGVHARAVPLLMTDPGATTEMAKQALDIALVSSP